VQPRGRRSFPIHAHIYPPLDIYRSWVDPVSLNCILNARQEKIDNKKELGTVSVVEIDLNFTAGLDIVKTVERLVSTDGPLTSPGEAESQSTTMLKTLAALPKTSQQVIEGNEGSCVDQSYLIICLRV